MWVDPGCKFELANFMNMDTAVHTNLTKTAKCAGVNELSKRRFLNHTKSPMDRDKCSGAERAALSSLYFMGLVLL
jgi:hypothetical protein